MSFPLWFAPPSRDDPASRSVRLALVQDEDSVSSRPGSHPDADIIARIRIGDREAFAELFHTYYPRLTAYASSLVGNADDAHDLVCDLFVHLFVAHAAFAPAGPVRAYLFRAVRNKVVSVQRTRSVATRHATQQQAGLEQQTSMSGGIATRPGDDPAILDAIEAAFAALPTRAREAASLRWKDGLSLDEIATTMGIAKASVAMLLSRTLKTLRQELAPLREFVRETE